MVTLYGPSEPILLPGKTESVSRYGLKKTSGTILFRPAQLIDAETLAKGNGIVFPVAQIRTTEIGLLEMSFDSYEDTGGGTGVFNLEIQNFSKAFETTERGTTYNWNVSEIWTADSFTEFKVVSSKNGSSSLQSSASTLGHTMIKRVVTGNFPPGVNPQLTITWISQITSMTRKNWGDFDEVDIVTSQIATIA